MTKKIVDHLLDAQIKSGVLDDKSIPVYRYGYTLLVEVCINFILALIVGVVMGEIGIVLLFNLAFVPLRGFCGGWHAGKSWMCTIASLAVLVLSVVIGKFEWIQYETSLWVAIMIVACIVILWLAPIDSEAKPLSSGEVKHYKKIIRVILAVEAIGFLLLTYFQVYKFAGIFCSVLYIQSCSLLISVVIDKKYRVRKGHGGKQDGRD